jgi:hypothetical protein
MNDQYFAAYGMQPQDRVEALAPALDCAWPVDETPFSELLLLVIDEADREASGHFAKIQERQLSRAN